MRYDHLIEQYFGKLDYNWYTAIRSEFLLKYQVKLEGKDQRMSKEDLIKFHKYSFKREDYDSSSKFCVPFLNTVEEFYDRLRSDTLNRYRDRESEYMAKKVWNKIEKTLEEGWKIASKADQMRFCTYYILKIRDDYKIKIQQLFCHSYSFNSTRKQLQLNTRGKEKFVEPLVSSLVISLLLKVKCCDNPKIKVDKRSIEEAAAILHKLLDKQALGHTEFLNFKGDKGQIAFLLNSLCKVSPATTNDLLSGEDIYINDELITSQNLRQLASRFAKSKVNSKYLERVSPFFPSHLSAKNKKIPSEKK